MKARPDYDGTVYGPAGYAIHVPVDLEPDDPPAKQGTVSAWLLHCPGQSPAWDRYVMSIVHLRPIPDTPPPEVRVPHATHELYLFACDPRDGHPTPDDPETWRPLIPLNLALQLQLPDDEAASALLESAVRYAIAGQAWVEPPFPGYVEPWMTVLLKTAAHARGEVHAP